MSRHGNSASDRLAAMRLLDDPERARLREIIGRLNRVLDDLVELDRQERETEQNGKEHRDDAP